MEHGKYIKWSIAAVNVLLILCMVYTVASSAGYTVFLGDDYTHGVRVGVFHAPFFQYAVASLRYMKEIYLDWQGTYFAMFLQAFLSPLNQFGLAQLKIVMILNAMLFFVSLFGMVWVVFDFVLKDGKTPWVRLTVFSAVLFSVLDADVFTEVFFWYSGAVAYSIPFSCGLFAGMCFFLSNKMRYSVKKKTVFAICAAVLGFLASGGSLTVSGTVCYAFLLLTAGFYLSTGKVSGRNIFVTASAIAGALVNVAAPGNYARHTYNNGGDSGSWRLVQAVKEAVKIVLAECERLTKETMFGVMLMVMLLVGVYLSKKLCGRLKAYAIISALALGAGFVTAFPVVLGYGGSEFPNRCYFILDVVLVLSLLNFMALAGACMDRWAKICEDQRTWAVLFVLLFAVCLLSPEKISDSAVVLVAKSKHSGSYENYYEECLLMYDTLAHSPEDDVVLKVPEYIANFECFYLDEDPEGWVNVGMAEYYHKNSVRKAAEDEED